MTVRVTLYTGGHGQTRSQVAGRLRSLQSASERLPSLAMEIRHQWVRYLPSRLQTGEGPHSDLRAIRRADTRWSRNRPSMSSAKLCVAATSRSSDSQGERSSRQRSCWNQCTQDALSQWSRVHIREYGSERKERTCLPNVSEGAGKGTVDTLSRRSRNDRSEYDMAQRKVSSVSCLQESGREDA